MDKSKLVFYIEKDNAFKNSMSFRYKITKKYGQLENINKLYNKIINYQVKKYGQSLCPTNRRYINE